MELVRRYSNRLDLRDQLAEARSRARQLEGQEPDSAETWGRVPGGQRGRLTEADIKQLITDFLASTPKWALAETYVVSLSTVKNILRKHGVRRQLEPK